MNKKFTKTRFIGKFSEFMPTCHSTNDIAAKLLTGNNVGQGTVVYTDYQTKGKGQRGNSWESEPGKNILASIILTPDFLHVKDNFMLTVIFSLAVTDTLQGLVKNGIKIKWPNDIYYNDHKLAGILIQNFLQQTSIRASILGIGLNVQQKSFNEPKAISLFNILNTPPDRFEILETLCLALENRYEELVNGKNEELMQTYLRRLYRINETHNYRQGSQVFRGTIRGIGLLGRLQVETENGVKEYDLKEIEFL